MAETGPTKSAALALLGLPSGATQAQITTAYRRLARACHPDRCGDPGAAERFAALTEAYRHLIESAEVQHAPVARVRRPVRRVTPVGRPTRTVPLVAGPVRFVPWTAADSGRGR